jgi:hypothetical protein
LTIFCLTCKLVLSHEKYVSIIVNQTMLIYEYKTYLFDFTFIDLFCVIGQIGYFAYIDKKLIIIIMIYGNVINISLLLYYSDAKILQ